jgi:hypothetical protein
MSMGSAQCLLYADCNILQQQHAYAMLLLLSAAIAAAACTWFVTGSLVTH